jgi:hypothetical protein
MGSIKWEDVVKQSIPVFEGFISRNVIPTLRTIHYALVSKNIIPNTKTAYKGLSSAFVKARQEGIVKWSWLADEGRDIEEGENNYVWKPEQYADSRMERAIDDLKRVLEGSTYFSYPKWMNQQYYVEVWIEKNALRATFKNYIQDFNITLVPSRGYSSWTFLKEANDRIRRNANGKTPLILYFGDFDPTGEDIERFLRDSMNGFFGLVLEVKRIGVTKDQIEQYNLPTTPEDAEEIEKLHRDSRFKNWEHGNYRVELDALLAFVPDEFERIIKESIQEYFDEDVYTDVLVKEDEGKELIRERLTSELPQKIKDLLKELGLENGDE